MAEKMLTVKEVAEAISVTEWAVRQWVRKGQVPGAVKFGNTIRIPESFLLGGTAEERAEADREIPKGIDADPRDEWPSEKPGKTDEAPEPIEPPTTDEDEDED